jgi:hypothetical protein
MTNVICHDMQAATSRLCFWLDTTLDTACGIVFGARNTMALEHSNASCFFACQHVDGIVACMGRIVQSLLYLLCMLPFPVPQTLFKEQCASDLLS